MDSRLLTLSVIAATVSVGSNVILGNHLAVVGSLQGTLSSSPARTFTFRMPRIMHFWAMPTVSETLPTNGVPTNGSPLNGPPLNGAPLNGSPLNGAPISGLGPRTGYSSFILPQPRLVMPTPDTAQTAPTQSWFMLPRPRLVMPTQPSVVPPSTPPTVTPPMHGAPTTPVAPIPLPDPANAERRRPVAPPASSSAPAMYCGDETCNNGETTATCPMDCPSTATTSTTPVEFCGDTTCNNGETTASCPADCPTAASSATPAPYCGDGTCNGAETSATCSMDCHSAAATSSVGWCGNTICDAGETSMSCPMDCY